MSRRPALTIDAAQWRAQTSIQTLSMTARAVLLELALAGLIEPTPVDLDRLRLTLRVAPKPWAKALTELETAGLLAQGAPTKAAPFRKAAAARPKTTDENQLELFREAGRRGARKRWETQQPKPLDSPHIAPTSPHSSIDERSTNERTNERAEPDNRPPAERLAAWMHSRTGNLDPEFAQRILDASPNAKDVDQLIAELERWTAKRPVRTNGYFLTTAQRRFGPTAADKQAAAQKDRKHLEATTRALAEHRAALAAALAEGDHDKHLALIKRGPKAA